jgi:heterogeneous nuclear ribonucleoprotein A1/A3
MDYLLCCQVIFSLHNRAESIPEALEVIEEKAQTDPVHRKLFIRGLSWETTDDMLREVFSPFGELEDCAVVVDRHTGKSKGYGFVTFKHMDDAYAALECPEKEIDVSFVHGVTVKISE